MSIPLSVLDPLPVLDGMTHGDAVEAGIALARRADALGYRRIWYTEHHNQEGYAASATSVLIAHVAARTRRIRVGAGGVMLPNHSPLVVAEHFGTLATLHPDRIDLGMGRGVGGTSSPTLRALRRDSSAADAYPEHVRELRAYLWEGTDASEVRAIPGTGTRVPLYVLGSSVSGARLAASLGLPYCFASHFAPAALEEAVDVYRTEFRASPQNAEPYVIAGVNVTAARTTEEAREQARLTQHLLAERLVPERAPLSAEQAQAVLDSPTGREVLRRYRYSAVGDPGEVARYLDWFGRHARADELIIEFQTRTAEARAISLEAVAEEALPAGA
ncbi:LLM class flavin-dependent oxidoreductase [Nocardiopsis sp. ATB16-24]|uniref:LLM class flavin-dependent oxidoreductase n=1 Tax=Nocardiopsis sp. ATB16-24 TaxID=3019555 RepID=UPI0025563D38|nr:LLM class flavin-dependent oxidoreductase [Nocardiopsis sp. ATB16-24]